MKKIKIPSLIPFVITLIIVSLLFIFMVIPQNRSNVTAENGVLDLRGETEIAPLNGEWEFVFGELLMPDEFGERQADTITVPSTWVSAGHEMHGFATYRLTIYTDWEQPLTLFVSQIYTANKLFVNGVEARTAGVVSANPAEGRMLYENTLLPVVAENGVIELVFQVSNYHNNTAGITTTLLLGDTVEVQRWFFRTRVIAAIAIGSLLMTAFYHLTLYVYRRKETAYLLFAILCFVCFGRFMMESDSLNTFFQWIPENQYGRMFYRFFLFTHVCSIFIFLLYLFDKEFIRKYKFLIIGKVVLIYLFGTLAPENPLTYILPLVLNLIALYVAARSPALKESVEMKLCFSALLVFIFVGTPVMMFFSHTFYKMGLVNNIFMIMVQSMALSRKYTDAFHFVEETNTNLEKIVDERTESLKAANEAMVITNNSMKELIANISHDLKTPLSVLSVNLESLSELAETQSSSEYQRHVRSAYQKNLDLQRLVQNLFEVSRIETGKDVYAPEWLSTYKLLSQAKEKYDIFIEDVGLTFDVLLDDNAEISIDPQKVWSVFDNVIYNAVRYTEKGGNITITTKNEKSTVTITVEDTGCGIPDEHLSRLFERFYRVSQARSEQEGESGLGLYIVKSIMEGCGGSVYAESEVGKGTKIILRFNKKTQ